MEKHRMANLLAKYAPCLADLSKHWLDTDDKSLVTPVAIQTKQLSPAIHG